MRTYCLSIVPLLLAIGCVALSTGSEIDDVLPSLRDACEADLMTLQPCAQGNADFTQLCCAAVKALNANGCFCAWSTADYISGWTRSALLDLEELYERCTDQAVMCSDDRTPSMMFAMPIAADDDGAVLMAREDIDVLERLQGWLEALPGTEYASIQATSGNSNHRTLVLEWMQQIESSMPSNLLTHDVEFELQISNAAPNSNRDSWRCALLADLQLMSDWLVNSIFGLVRATTTYEDRMDRTDDIRVLVGSLVEVVDQLTQQMDGEDFSMSLELTIEEDEDEEHLQRAVNEVPCAKQLAEAPEELARQLQAPRYYGDDDYVDAINIYEDSEHIYNRPDMSDHAGNPDGWLESTLLSDEPRGAPWGGLWLWCSQPIAGTIVWIWLVVGTVLALVAVIRHSLSDSTAATSPVVSYAALPSLSPPTPAESALSKPLLQNAMEGGH